MINVRWIQEEKITNRQFELFSEALIFARSKDVGVTFEIREDDTLLATGTITDYEDKDYE